MTAQANLQVGRAARYWIKSVGQPTLATVCLVAITLLQTACSAGADRPVATRVPIAEIEKTYGHLLTVANEPTLPQHGTGDWLGLFQDDTGTIWGIPLAANEDGSLMACAPAALREASPSDTLPDKSVEIVGAANEPSGWREGAGALELLLRYPNGQLRWQQVRPLELTSGPVCMSQKTQGQSLKYYRLVRQGSAAQVPAPK